MMYSYKKKRKKEKSAMMYSYQKKKEKKKERKKCNDVFFLSIFLSLCVVSQKLHFMKCNLNCICTPFSINLNFGVFS